jgi:hypothetical protein
MADVGDTAQNRRTLYELNKTCSSDWMTAFGPRLCENARGQNVATHFSHVGSISCDTRRSNCVLAHLQSIEFRFHTASARSGHAATARDVSIGRE